MTDSSQNPLFRGEGQCLTIPGRFMFLSGSSHIMLSLILIYPHSSIVTKSDHRPKEYLNFCVILTAYIAALFLKLKWKF